MRLLLRHKGVSIPRLGLYTMVLNYAHHIGVWDAWVLNA